MDCGLQRTLAWELPAWTSKTAFCSYCKYGSLESVTMTTG